MNRLFNLINALILAILLASGTAQAQSQTIFSLDLEGGLVFSGYNKIRIPGNTGTYFNAYKDLKQNAQPYYRIRPTLTLGRHAISALFAPLELKYTGSLAQATDFNGNKFSPDSPIKLRYRFNSYRLTYR